MRILILIIAVILLIAFGAFSQNNSEGISITVQIKDLSNDKGKMMIALYNSEESFLNHPYKVAMETILNNESTIIFKNIESGTYAISCYHDKNSNQELDLNGMGIPEEPTGASNNAKGFFGPPKFKDAKFEVITDNKKLTINL